MTRQDAFNEINQTQDYYIGELIKEINDNNNIMKEINFTSPTGTGKTKMMSKLINLLPNFYFVVTTLSKGQLNSQIEDNLKKDCKQDNFVVYGNAQFKSNSKLTAEDIISQIPKNVKCIWLRDEGHINTNKFMELLSNFCYKIINFSATPKEKQGISCNFTHTMMLRSVNQATGTPEDAIQKLLEVKEQHKNVPNYNPCAIFRCVSGDESIINTIIDLCNQYNLNIISLIEDKKDKNNIILQPLNSTKVPTIKELCEDDNEYDVIINKHKIVEGIDIRRSHILYMDNQPNNNSTTIQVIGRCRRNALLYRKDIDIFASENEQLLKDTRECYVFYNVEQMRVDEDENGELQPALCKYISCEALKPNITISVIDGQLPNGLTVLELEGYTGDFKVIVDKNIGFNIIEPITTFYDTEIRNHDNYIYVYPTPNKDENWKRKIHIEKISQLPLHTTETYFDYSIGQNNEIDCEPYYILEPIHTEFSKYPNDTEYPDLFEDITEDEKYLLDNKFASPIKKITQKELKEYKIYKYKKITNDRESAIIGVDLMHQIKDDNGNIKWKESKSVSSKVDNCNKFSKFLETQYVDEILQGTSQCFTGENNFTLDKKCMSALGYCVEYYSKYLVYGETYLSRHIIMAQKESHTDIINNFIIVRACMLKYKEMMVNSFGKAVAKVIKTISTQELIRDNYKEFVELVVSLGTKTSDFVKEMLYQNQEPKDDIDPNLSIKHISGLADYITKDTILDIKVRNNIDSICVKQVLGYHYLSTKRSDLDINKVIIYDATSGKSVIIHITNKNKIKNNFDNANIVKCNVLNADYSTSLDENEEYKDENIIDSFEEIVENNINHIGETIIANNGQKMMIVKYNNFSDIDVQFEDGTIVEHRLYQEFQKGSISNPNFNPQCFIKIGSSKIASNGQKMTIIAYRDSKNIDVQFDDGTIVENVRFEYFEKGWVTNPNLLSKFNSSNPHKHHIGESKIANNGKKMTIIEYRNYKDIDIQFDNGTIVQHKHYDNFLSGKIKDTIIDTKKRLGETNTNTQGLKMTIVVYRNNHNIDVQFDDKTLVQHKTYQSFKNGKIANPNFKKG